jgi:hypothetical protein
MSLQGNSAGLCEGLGRRFWNHGTVGLYLCGEGVEAVREFRFGRYVDTSFECGLGVVSGQVALPVE